MKKLLLAAFFLFFIGITNAQDAARFGLTGGLLNTNVNFDFTLSNLSASNNTGFYIGAIADVPLSEKLHFQPEFTYGSAGDLGFIFVPAMLKFYATGYDINESFTIQARYSLELTNRYNGPGSGLLTLNAQQLTVGMAYFFN